MYQREEEDAGKREGTEGKELLKERTKERTGERTRKTETDDVVLRDANVPLVCRAARIIMNRTKLIFPVERAARIPYSRKTRDLPCHFSVRARARFYHDTRVYDSRNHNSEKFNLRF